MDLGGNSVSFSLRGKGLVVEEVSRKLGIPCGEEFVRARRLQIERSLQSRPFSAAQKDDGFRVWGYQVSEEESDTIVVDCSCDGECTIMERLSRKLLATLAPVEDRIETLREKQSLHAAIVLWYDKGYAFTLSSGVTNQLARLCDDIRFICMDRGVDDVEHS